MSTGLPRRQIAGLNSRFVGEFVVTALSDGYMDAPFALLAGITEDESKALLEAVDRPPVMRINYGAYLIEGNGRVMLLDSGVGRYAGTGSTINPLIVERGGGVVNGLRAMGIGPEKVDTILLTHCHYDHIGGLTDHDGFAVFPKAELVIHRDEHAFWISETVYGSVPSEVRPMFDMARAVFHAYRDRLRFLTDGQVVTHGVTLEHLPGHTPGHSGYRIESLGQSLLVWADAVHMPDIQIPRPEVSIAFDADADQAAATRRRLLDMASHDHLPLGGTHLNLPGFIRVESRSGKFSIAETPWSPAIL